MMTEPSDITRLLQRAQNPDDKDLLSDLSTNRMNRHEKKEPEKGRADALCPSLIRVDSCDSWIHATPKITDFGLAKRLDADAGQTQSDAIVGTPSYMAPEQAAGRSKQVGPAADVYSLGAILYQLLTGGPPFRAATSLETLEQVRIQEPMPPRRLQPKLPRDLETICLKCLEKEPHKRYASAAALADDLRRFLRNEPIWARPVGPVERARRWCRRRPAVSALLASLLLALIGWAVTSTVLLRRALEHLQKEETARHEAEDSAQRNQQLLADMVEYGSQPPGREDALQAVSNVELLQKAVHNYDALIQKRPEEVDLYIARADAYAGMGHQHRILSRTGTAKEDHTQLATQAYLRSMQELGELLRQHPADVSIANRLIQVCGWLVFDNQDREQLAQARDLAQKAGVVLIHRYADIPADAADLRHSFGKRSQDLVGLLLGSGVPSEALPWAERATQVFRELFDAAPERLPYGIELGKSWYQTGKTHWRLGQYEAALDAFRQCVAMLKRVHEQAPSVDEYRQQFSLCWLRLAYWLSRRGQLAEAAECLVGVEKLWPEDAERLREVAEDWRKLAGAVGQGHPELTPAEQAERQRYREAGGRLERKADALTRDRTKPAPEGLTPPVRQ